MCKMLALHDFEGRERKHEKFSLIFLFPVLLLLSHIIKNPQLCFSVRSRTEKVKKNKKNLPPLVLFSEFVSSAEFQSFELIPRGVL